MRREEMECKVCQFQTLTRDLNPIDFVFYFPFNRKHNAKPSIFGLTKYLHNPFVIYSHDFSHHVIVVMNGQMQQLLAEKKSSQIFIHPALKSNIDVNNTSLIV